LLAHGWWFSPGTPASSTTETGRHDIADILLKVSLNTKNQINQSIFSHSGYGFTTQLDNLLKNTILLDHTLGMIHIKFGFNLLSDFREVVLLNSLPVLNETQLVHNHPSCSSPP